MPLEIKVPTIGESVTEVTVAQFLVEDGSYVEMDQLLCELESDKATFELPAEAAGIVKFVVEEGDDIAVGAVVCTIDTSASESGDSDASTETTTTEETSKTEADTDTTESTAESEQQMTPVAANLMAEHKLKADQVKGTGPNGRITKSDVLNHIEQQKTAKTTPPPKPESKPAPKATTPATPAASGERGEERKKMSRIRKTIAKRLVNAKNNTAMLTTFNEVDLSEVIALRKKYKETFKEKHGIGLGFMSFFLKASAMALMDFPAVNAYLDEDYIIYHDYVDISIAVSTPKGLVVPIIRNAETLSMKQLEEAVYTLAMKGRDNELTMEDMTGGTFTVSNGGIFGSLQSTPIINPPQSAILGMHKIQQRPVVVNGDIVARPMMYLALSYDHRIIDGKEAVTFLVRIKELLEEPVKLFLDL